MADDQAEERQKWLEGKLPNIYKELSDELVRSVSSDPSNKITRMLEEMYTLGKDPDNEKEGDDQ